MSAIHQGSGTATPDAPIRTESRAGVAVPDPARGRPLLQTALRENAAFCASSGGAMALGAIWLDEWAGVHAGILAALGIGLVLYAAALARLAGQLHTLVETGRVAVAGDVSWLVGAAVVIAGTDVLTGRAEVALGLLSVVVACFAVGQVIGLGRLSR